MIGLEVNDLCASYGKTPVLRGISFTAQSGDVTTIVGPNGTGKSTLLKSVAGVIKSYGSVKIKGREKENYSRKSLRKIISYMTQSNDSRSNLSVFEMVLLGRLQSLSLMVEKTDLNKTWSTLEGLGLTDIADRPFSKLSGGQQRMVSIAQALVSDPEILIMDEPTANLDLKRELEVLDLIKKYTTERNMTTIMTLHDLNMAMRWSSNVVLLKDGILLNSGTPDVVLSEESIEEAYGVRSRIMKTEEGERLIIPLS